jgi:hypothetical protein
MNTKQYEEEIKKELENEIIEFEKKWGKREQSDKIFYLKTKLKTVQEVSKAKDEEFKEILNGWYNSLNTSLDCLTKTIHDKDFEKLKREIKQRRKEE